AYHFMLSIFLFKLSENVQRFGALSRNREAVSEIAQGPSLSSRQFNCLPKLRHGFGVMSLLEISQTQVFMRSRIIRVEVDNGFTLCDCGIRVAFREISVCQGRADRGRKRIKLVGMLDFRHCLINSSQTQ